MRINRISLENYRGVGKANISLAPSGVTIIQGPNEVGKSSLAEALQFLLEEPDSSTKRRLKAAKPVNVDAGPSIEVDLETGPYHVVYSKRWLKGPATSLQVLAPTPESLTGRAAHDRMDTILDETLDRTLWHALWYQQGEAICQAQVGESRSLAAALDAAATSGALGGSGDADLWTRVQEERLRYFTQTGRPTADRTHLEGKVTELRHQAEELQAGLMALEAAAERYRRLGMDLADNGVQQVEQSALVDRYAAQWSDVSALQRAVESLSQAAQTVTARAKEALAADEERGRLVAALNSAGEALRDLATQAEHAAPGLESARAAQSVARQERDAAKETRRQAEEASRLASGDFEHFREMLDCQFLEERQERIASAEQASSQAAKFLETCRIDDKKLARIEAASLAASEARARLAGQNPTIQVEALRDLELDTGEKPIGLRAGQSFEAVVAGDVELILKDVARICVSGGAATLAVQDAAQAADEDLTKLLKAAGISGEDSLGQARDLARQRREALAESDRAAQVLKENLRDLTPQLVLDKIERLRVTIAAYAGERESSSPLPADLDAAKVISDQAADALEDVRRHEGECQDKLEQATEIFAGLQHEASQRTGQIDVAQQAVRSAEKQLETARSRDSDTDLKTLREKMEEEAAEAEAELQAKEYELASADPESVALLLKNARDVLGRLRTESQTLELESARIKRELEIRGEAGLHDQLTLVESELAQREREKTLMDRRAAAAELLHTRMSADRDDAKRSYILPFKQQLDAFSRIVFGPTASIEVDHETLEITSRTRDGITVPYDSLSSGTKEQLCVLSRLACAALVSPASVDQADAGVPVIFDDALGYSDPGRLERVGAAFNAAGGQSQVIVLTCVPERYRNIGSASVVYLEETSLDPDIDGVLSS